LNPAFVTGLGFWAPGLDGPLALASGRSDATVTEPASALLSSGLARRASPLTRMLVEVATQAGQRGSVDLEKVATVFASSCGEIEVLRSLLETLDTGGELSPTAFHNSVYNTASGYFSIAAANRSFATTIAAGDQTVAMALLEAFCVLEERRNPVIVAFADEPSTIPFLWREGAQAMAAALCLSAERPAEPCFGRLGAPRTGQITALPAVDRAFVLNPVVPALSLVRALQLGETGTMALGRETGKGWTVDILPGTGG